MAKRRLNLQQQRRIAAKQLSTETEPGLIVAHYGQTLDVEAADGSRFRCFARQNLGALVTGDRVQWQRDEDQPGSGVISAVAARTSLLQRPDGQGQLKPIAANIDMLFVVAAVVPEPVPYFIDKYLVAAEYNRLPACIILNKMDLLQNAKTMDELAARYTDIGYHVLRCSAETGEGMAEIVDQLSAKTGIFLGQSGVGKSSLLNTILGDQIAAVGDISEANRKGRHTTTTAKLYHLPNGGQIIDSPGIREYGLTHLTPQDMVQGFKEFQPFFGQCRFRDCAHRQEPDCALQNAVMAGKISASRFASFQRMVDQADKE